MSRPFQGILGKSTIPTYSVLLSNDESTVTMQNELDIKKGHFIIDELRTAISYKMEKILA